MEVKRSRGWEFSHARGRFGQSRAGAASNVHNIEGVDDHDLFIVLCVYWLCYSSCFGGNVGMVSKPTGPSSTVDLKVGAPTSTSYLPHLRRCCTISG